MPRRSRRLPAPRAVCSRRRRRSLRPFPEARHEFRRTDALDHRTRTALGTRRERLVGLRRSERARVSARAPGRPHHVVPGRREERRAPYEVVRGPRRLDRRKRWRRRRLRVQLIRVLRPSAMAVAVCLGWVAHAAAQSEFDDDMLHSLMRTFTDSKNVGVRSFMGDYMLPLPDQMALSLHVNNEQVTIPGVSAPAGSQEAIDAITTASRPISGNAFEDYVKVRNEVQGEVTRGPAAVSLYLSAEKDYLAHQVAARYGRDFENQQLNVTVGSSYGWDDIKPLADSDTQTGNQTKTTMHLDAVATRVLSPTTMVRFGLEYNLVEGLQHNPYRNVYAGGTNVPERHPDMRQRQDAFVKLNQYLANHSS